jgi:hypothetical protein
MISPKKKRTIVLPGGERLTIRQAIRRANKAKRESAANESKEAKAA